MIPAYNQNIRLNYRKKVLENDSSINIDCVVLD